MCPFCLSTVGLIVIGTVSSGGLAALAVKISHKKNSAGDVIAGPKESNISDGNQLSDGNQQG